MRSITAPDMIDAVVKEKSRNANQKTPVRWSERLGPILELQGRASRASSLFTGSP